MCDASTMKLALLNTRSLQCHIDDILNSIYLEACNIAVFTEARLINTQSIPLRLSDKEVFAVNAPAEHNNVGGVAVVISRCKSACELLTVSHEKFQLIAVRVAFNEEITLTIAALYCSPSLSSSELKCNVQRYIESLVHDHSEPVIILGDFNIDARHATVITGTHQHVCRPTHVDRSILDHVYIFFTAACRFLDGALGPQRTQLTIDVPVSNFIDQNQLRIGCVVGDGHCLLHSWSRSTGSPLATIKQTVITEYLNNRHMYLNAGISEDELRRYLRCRDYNLNAADAVLNILCNAYHVRAYIIGSDVHASSTVTLVQHISCVGNVQTDATVLLPKTSDHYNSLF